MSKPAKYCFYLIVLVCFSIRIIFINHQSLWPDEALYLFISKNLASNPFDLRDIHGNLFYLNPPFFLYILSLLVRIDVLDPRIIAHLLTILFDTGTIIMAFFIAKELFGTSVGLVSAGLLSINTLHWSVSTRVLIDGPLTFFVYLALFMLMRKKTAMACLFSIFATATKFTGAPLLFIPLISENRLKRSPWAWLGIYILGIVAMFLLVTYPFQTRHEWLNYFIGFFKAPNFLEMYREAEFFLGLFICFFFFIGLGTALKKKDFSPLLSWVFVYGAVRLFLPWMAFRFCRYTLPLYPAICIFAAYGGITSFRFLQRKLPGRTPFLRVVFGLVFLYVVSDSAYNGYTTTVRINNRGIGYEAVQNFFTNRLTNKTVLTSSPRQVKYMVPELTVYDLLGDTTPEKTRLFIEQKGINYVLLDRWSPHQPDWAEYYFILEKGYHPAYQTRNLIILEVDANPAS